MKTRRTVVTLVRHTILQHEMVNSMSRVDWESNENRLKDAPIDVYAIFSSATHTHCAPLT